MKNKLAQIAFFFNKFDRHQLQFLYFIFVLAVSFVLRAPADGGGEPI